MKSTSTDEGNKPERVCEDKSEGNGVERKSCPMSNIEPPPVTNMSGHRSLFVYDIFSELAIKYVHTCQALAKLVSLFAVSTMF